MKSPLYYTIITHPLHRTIMYTIKYSMIGGRALQLAREEPQLTCLDEMSPYYYQGHTGTKLIVLAYYHIRPVPHCTMCQAIELGS